MNGAELLLECLKEQGVKVIFGIPGSLAREIDAALYKQKSSITYIMTRTEVGAAYMAEAYARVTNEIGVLMTVPGPGSANAYAGMLEAYTANSGVLLITAQNESHHKERDQSKMGHGLDQLGAFGPITKCAKRIEIANEIPEVIYTIFGKLRSGRPMPALLEITRDALYEECSASVRKKNEGIKLEPDIEQIQMVVEELKKVKKPCIIAGRGVFHCSAGAELLELARRLSAPVITTKMGKGVVSEDERLVIGDIGRQDALAAIKSSDMILAVGVRFTQSDTNSWSLKLPENIIRIDADPEEINREYKPLLGIAADVKLTIQRILAELGDQALLNIDKERVETLTREKTSHKRLGWKYISLLNDVLPENGVLSVDMLRVGYHTVKYIKVKEAAAFLHTPVSMAMGYALPSAIGAKIACPDKTMIVYCGDGGFVQSSPEIATIMKYDLDIVIVLMNDASYSTISSLQLDHSGIDMEFSLVNPDFSKLSESYGMDYFLVEHTEDFAPTIKRAIELKKAVLVEVIPENTLKRQAKRLLKSMVTGKPQGASKRFD